MAGGTSNVDEKILDWMGMAGVMTWVVEGGVQSRLGLIGSGDCFDEAVVVGGIRSGCCLVVVDFVEVKVVGGVCVGSVLLKPNADFNRLKIPTCSCISGFLDSTAFCWGLSLSGAAVFSTTTFESITGLVVDSVAATAFTAFDLIAGDSVGFFPVSGCCGFVSAAEELTGKELWIFPSDLEATEVCSCFLAVAASDIDFDCSGLVSVKAGAWVVLLSTAAFVS
jgi:hypothetical protein